MPYVSDAQRRLFHAKANRGEISKATVHHWDEATKGKKLPERVKKGAVGDVSSSTGFSSTGFSSTGVPHQIYSGRWIPAVEGVKSVLRTPQPPARIGALGAATGIAGAGLAAFGIHKLLQKIYGSKGEHVKKEACVKLASALATLPEKSRVKLAAVLYVYAKRSKRAALLLSKPAVRKGTSMQKIQAKVAAYIQKQAMPLAAAAAVPAAAAAIPTIGSWLLSSALPALGTGAAFTAGSKGLEKLLRKKEPVPPQGGAGMPGSGMPQH